VKNFYLVTLLQKPFISFFQYFFVHLRKKNIYIKISLVSFLSLFSAYTVQGYILAPIENFIFSPSEPTHFLFLPHCIMALLAIYFGGASVMAIFCRPYRCLLFN